MIGGDFNTNTLDRGNHERPAIVLDACAMIHCASIPDAYEPMFQELRRPGYDWEVATVMGARTQRTRQMELREALGRIDWFFPGV